LAGLFTILAVPVGSAVFMRAVERPQDADAADPAPAGVRLLPAGSEDADVDLVLVRGGLLEVLVPGPDGKPWEQGAELPLGNRFDPWAFVSGDCASVRHDEVTLEGSGRHVFRRVPADCMLVLTAPAAATCWTSATSGRSAVTRACTPGPLCCSTAA